MNQIKQSQEENNTQDPNFLKFIKSQFEFYTNYMQNVTNENYPHPKHSQIVPNEIPTPLINIDKENPNISFQNQKSQLSTPVMNENSHEYQPLNYASNRFSSNNLNLGDSSNLPTMNINSKNEQKPSLNNGEIDTSEENLIHSISTMSGSSKITCFFIKDKITITNWYGKCKDHTRCSGRCVAKRICKKIDGNLKIFITDFKITKKSSLPHSEHSYSLKSELEILLEKKQFDKININDIKIKRKVFKFLITQKPNASNNDLILKFAEYFPTESCLSSKDISSVKQNLKKKMSIKTDNESLLDDLKTFTHEPLNSSVLKFRNEKGKEETCRLLATPNMIKRLQDKNITQLFIDGTFTAVVAGYTQPIVCLAWDGTIKEIRPVFFGLLQSKTKVAYKHLFMQAKISISKIAPITITLDFEIALIEVNKNKK